MRASVILVAIGMAGGAGLDLAPPPAPVARDGEEVLKVDLHVHTFFGDGTLSPPHLLLEARRRGLDALAVTNHNQVAVARITRALARAAGGPTVLVGEEVTAPGWHLIGVGLRRTVDWRLPLPAAIDAVHAQGGAAILAHPVPPFRAAATDEALRSLDGIEVDHPVADVSPEGARELLEPYERARALGHPLAPIGSSDDHGLGSLGAHRTFVFARENSEPAIVAAIRAGRTVVLAGGRAFGDPALVARLPPSPPRGPGWTVTLVGLIGWTGVALLLLLRPLTRGSALE